MSAKPPRSSKKARMTAARLAAVQLLYQSALSQRPLAELKSEFLEHYQGRPLDGEEFVKADEAHFLSLVDLAESYQFQMDEAVDAAIHRSQPSKITENLEPLLRLILRCGAVEILHKLAEKPIAVNDYVNVAKAFYALKEPAFVNAVLDSL